MVDVLLGDVWCVTVRIDVLVKPHGTKREGSVGNFMEVEKKGGEEHGVMSTVISSINMWNRPMRLVWEETVVDASTSVGSLSVCHRPKSLLFAKQTARRVCCVDCFF